MIRGSQTSKEYVDLCNILASRGIIMGEQIEKECERLLMFYVDESERTAIADEYVLSLKALEREQFIKDVTKEANSLANFVWLSRDREQFFNRITQKGVKDIPGALSVAKDILSCVASSELKNASNGFEVLNNHLDDYFGNAKSDANVTAKQRCIAKLAMSDINFLKDNPSRLLDQLIQFGEFESYEQLLEAMK